CLSYYRRAGAPDLRYRVERSDRLEKWRAVADLATETIVRPASPGFDQVTLRIPAPFRPDNSTGYLRVRVERIAGR
ncbi:MAG: hypothetical protein GWO24_20815, partial [Akkermansiaceae bacterium]|nr:hypothetical protein [Akkermansiaceae bacterium]